MELFPSHIIINGQETTVDSLLQNSAEKTEWEKHWFAFLREWYNPQKYIEVQTSGSTGTPKTICLQKQFVAESAQRTILFFKLKKGDRILHCLPCNFIAGKLMIVRALLGELDLHPVDPATNFDFLQQKEPFRFAAMVVNQAKKYVDLSSKKVEHLLLGGSAIPKTLEEQLQQHPTLCYSSYAMTETATHIALRQLNGKQKSDTYHCLENITVDLNENRCIRIAMPGLAGGSIETNDLGELKNNTTFKVLGRADNVIISGGIKFIPEQIEEKLQQYIPLPIVITSMPDEQLGEKLILVTEGKQDLQVQSAIETKFKSQLSRYERPKQIIFINMIPKTKNGKVNRKQLKQQLTNTYPNT